MSYLNSFSELTFSALGFFSIITIYYVSNVLYYDVIRLFNLFEN